MLVRIQQDKLAIEPMVVNPLGNNIGIVSVMLPPSIVAIQNDAGDDAADDPDAANAHARKRERRASQDTESE